MEFEPVSPTGSAPPPSPVDLPPLPPMVVKPSPELEAAVEELRERWEAAQTQVTASALVTFEQPAPLLPGWGWPMADPEDPTPVYDELCKTMPDPRGTGPETPDDDTGEDR